MDAEEIKIIEQMLPRCQFCFDWMLETIVHKARETQGDNFSDELKLSIKVGEWLENYKGDLI